MSSLLRQQQHYCAPTWWTSIPLRRTISPSSPVTGFNGELSAFLTRPDEAISRYDRGVLREIAQAILRLDPENSDAIDYLAAAERDSGSSQPAEASPAPRPVPAPIGGQLTSFANSRYRVSWFLDECRKKMVLLAHGGIVDRALPWR